jgi:hypothetical protein
MADNWLSNLFNWGNDDVTYEDDPYGIGESYGAGDAFDYNDPYKNLSLDELLNLDYGDDAGWGDLFDFGWGDEDYGEDADDYWGLGGGYDDAFDFGSLGDDENNAFNEFLLNFDFNDPDADWAGGIGDLFDFGGLWAEGDDPDDRFDIGAGYDDAFGDIFGGDTKDPEYSILENLLFGQEYGADEGGIFSGDKFPRLAGFLNTLLGGADRAVDTVGGGIGSLLKHPLGQLALLNYMRNKKESDIHVPVGYGNGGGGGDGSPIDYRVFNLQPALMPGVAYANVGNDEPEGMKGGGLGDVTLARLEPGEFVVTKKAVDNVGAQNLYKMMKQWEGRG